MTRIGGIKMLCSLKRTHLMVRLLFQILVFPFFVSDTSYERLLSVLVGSYYVDVRTLNSEVPPNVITEDLIITRDALGKDFYFFLNRFLNSHSHQSSYLRKES